MPYVKKKNPKAVARGHAGGQAFAANRRAADEGKAALDADTVVVVKPGYEPPPVKEGLDDAEDDATTATTRADINQ